MNAGNLIGQYRIVRKLGAGGMGTVLLGEHTLLGRRAAIKTLLPGLSAQSDVVERFFNEARATSAISDPGVVQVFDFGYHVDGTAYIVMELLEGEALSARIDRLGKLPPPEALRIARQVAGSLAAAHARGIVHRDLKPENIYLIHDAEAQGGERTKLFDFGICKVDDATEAALTHSGTTLGTPVYMSPEQCRGAGHVDRRSDLYALGCVLFHMLTGRPPFEGEGSGDFIVAHLETRPPVPSSLAPELSPAIDALLLRCLAKAPEDRFQSMLELQAAIEPLLVAPSVPEIEIAAAPPAMLLSPGFRSAYDVNLASALSIKNALARVYPSSPPWFTGMPSPDASDREGELEEEEAGTSLLRRGAFAIAFMSGVLGAVIATRFMVPGTNAIAVAEPSRLVVDGGHDTAAGNDQGPADGPPLLELDPEPPPPARLPAVHVVNAGSASAPEVDAKDRSPARTEAEAAAADVKDPAPARGATNAAARVKEPVLARAATSRPAAKHTAKKKSVKASRPTPKRRTAPRRATPTTTTKQETATAAIEDLYDTR